MYTLKFPSGMVDSFYWNYYISYPDYFDLLKLFLIPEIYAKKNLYFEGFHLKTFESHLWINGVSSTYCDIYIFFKCLRCPYCFQSKYKDVLQLTFYWHRCLHLIHSHKMPFVCTNQLNWSASFTFVSQNNWIFSTSMYFSLDEAVLKNIFSV